MKLYHGSNVSIERVDLSKSKRGKDFGQGFYLNPNKNQARDMAESKADFMGGSPFVTAFEFDENVLKNDDLRVKIFEDYTIEWAEFVIMNRKNKNEKQAHNYDIVVGPIADDKVGVQIRQYILGYISVEKLIKELRAKQPSIQYFFATEKSLQHLKRINNG